MRKRRSVLEGSLQVGDNLPITNGSNRSSTSKGWHFGNVALPPVPAGTSNLTVMPFSSDNLHTLRSVEITVSTALSWRLFLDGLGATLDGMTFLTTAAQG
jgi:hypothetical protein